MTEKLDAAEKDLKEVKAKLEQNAKQYLQMKIKADETAQKLAQNDEKWKASLDKEVRNHQVKMVEK